MVDIAFFVCKQESWQHLYRSIIYLSDFIDFWSNFIFGSKTVIV